MRVSSFKSQVSRAGGAVLLGLGFLAWVAVCAFFLLSAIGLTGCAAKPRFDAVVTRADGKQAYRITGTWDDGQSALQKAAGPVGAMLAGLVQALTVVP